MAKITFINSSPNISKIPNTPIKVSCCDFPFFQNAINSVQIRKDKGWTYDDVAQIINLKNGKVVAATISRGLPAFAKLVVCVHEGKEG